MATPADDAKRLTEALERQERAFGKASRAAQIYELEVQGATAADLAQAKVLDENLTRLEKSRAAQDQFNRSMQSTAQGVMQAASAMSNALGRQLGGAITNSFDRAQTSVSAIGAVVRSLPGPLGVVGGLITDAIGGGLQAAAERARELRAVLDSTVSAVVRGSTNMRQALNQVEVGTFQTALERSMRMARDNPVMRTTSPGVSVVDEVRTAARLGRDVVNSITAAHAARQALLESMRDPVVAVATQGAFAAEGRAALNEQNLQRRMAAAQSRERIGGISSGLSVEEARDAGERLAVVQRHAEQIQRAGEGWSDAMDRARQNLRGELATLTEIQEIARRNAAQEALVVRARQDEITRDATRRNVEGLREQSRLGIQMVDNSRELAELDDQHRRGLIDDTTRARAFARIMENSRSTSGLMRAQEVNAAVERNLRPLELAQRQQRLLQAQRPEFLARAGGAEMFNREQATILQRVIDAAGDLYRLAPVFEFGAASTASAISRAEREQRGASPEALADAIRNLQIQGAEQSDYQRQLVEAARALPDELRAALGGAGIF